MEYKYDLNLSLENAISYLQLDSTTPKQSEMLLSMMRIELLEESLRFYEEMISGIKGKIDEEQKKLANLSAL